MQNNLERNFITPKLEEKDIENNLTEKSLLEFIENGKIKYIFSNLQKFSELSQKEIALKLIESGNGVEVGKNLHYFDNLDEDVFLKLIASDKNNSYWVVNHLDKFKGLDHKEIAFKIIEAGDGYSVGRYLNKFEGLNHREIALKMIECGQDRALSQNLDNFLPVDKDVLITLLEKGNDFYISGTKFKDFKIFDEEVISKFFEFASKYGLIINNFEKFQVSLDRKIALKMIEKGAGYTVASNLNKFKILDNEIANKLIESKNYFIIKNLDKFEGLDYKDIAFKIISNNKSGLVTTFIDQFPDVYHQEIASEIMRVGDTSELVKNIEKFKNLDYREIAVDIIRAGNGDDVVSHLDKFKGLNHVEIIDELINNNGIDVLIKHLNKFNNLDNKIAIELIKNNEIKCIQDNIEIFKLSANELYQDVKRILPDYIANLETKIPRLTDQLSKSTESLIGILEVKDNFSILEEIIDKNPFLLEALEKNPHYGSKLILKFREFDKTAKDNIREIFSIKEMILKENPKIDTASSEFRKLAQEKLSKYKENPGILEELKNRGVNVDNWLNYDKEINFTLGEQEDIKFSDKIKTPITRIKETLNKYQESIVSVLSYYKKELQSSFLPNPESIELKEKISKQEIKISEETDQKRKDGMEKGLNSLKSKLETLKPVSAWIKIQSDIFRLKSMIDNIFKFHDIRVLNESEIEDIKDRKELIKKKDELEKNKIQLKNSLKEFEVFFESYEDKLKELISPSLGEIRTSSLLQELKEILGEDLSHYNTDRNTLNSIFKDESVDSNSLNRREMKISISSRSPEDLYLGNYCPCCICIESQYHGEESPVADYVTDLGIQNIVVYDEKKNIPVVVCWSFVGQSSKDGKPVLVIDNIESNTEYTNNYPKQIKEVISKFIKNYAKASNIKKIIQGPYNNDLEVFNLGEVDKKIGGIYNRPGGYFLEAEKDEYEEEENTEYWQDDDDN